MISAANAAKVCAQVQYYCSSTYRERTGSGQCCWCAIGDIWQFSGYNSAWNDYSMLCPSGCSSYCPTVCGAQ
ncbi:MAG: hypothetical protein LBL21_02435 [Rickettsiales bacterium]|nr:hypothetical protein [Rickettsiales bacterium]